MEKLKIEYRGYDEYQSLYRAPSREELAKKVNELIDIVERLKRELELK